MARVSTDLTGNGLSFYALASGPVPSPFEKDNRYFPTDMVPLSVLDLGVLRVPSGRVEACDPSSLSVRIRSSRSGRATTRSRSPAPPTAPRWACTSTWVSWVRTTTGPEVHGGPGWLPVC